jgi:hypothetical protein
VRTVAADPFCCRRGRGSEGHAQKSANGGLSSPAMGGKVAAALRTPARQM